MSLPTATPSSQTTTANPQPDRTRPDRTRPDLILVDIQKGFGDTAYWGGERNNPDAESKAGDRLRHWR